MTCQLLPASQIALSAILAPLGVLPVQQADDPEQPMSSPRYAQAWADVDQDGFKDLFVFSPEVEARLFRNLGNGDFEDMTCDSNLLDIRGARAAIWDDFDGNSDADLLVATARGTLRLFLAVDPWLFEDATDAMGLGVLHGVSRIDAFDYDRDGRPDLRVDGLGGTLLYRNLAPSGFEPLRFDLPLVTSDATSPVSGPVPIRSMAQADPGDLQDSLRPPDRKTKTPRRGGRSAALASSGMVQAQRGPGVPVGPLPAQQLAALGVLPLVQASCVPTVEDQATGSCLSASSDPQQGLLYPLGPEFSIDSNGLVGIGTITPQARLDVSQGGIRAGVASDTAPVAALELSSAGLVQLGSAIGLRQTTELGDTRIFADSGPDVGWGIFHKCDTTREIHFTNGNGNGFETWTERAPDGSLDDVGSVFSVDLGSGNVRVNGDLMVNLQGTPEIVKPFRYKRLIAQNEGTTDLCTGYTADDYAVFIVSFLAKEGDMDENSNGDPIDLHTWVHPTTNEWHVRANFNTETDHEQWEVGILAIANNLIQEDGNALPVCGDVVQGGWWTGP